VEKPDLTAGNVDNATLAVCRWQQLLDELISCPHCVFCWLSLHMSVLFIQVCLLLSTFVSYYHFFVSYQITWH